MQIEIGSYAEAVLAAAHERISQRLHKRSYIELVDEYFVSKTPKLDKMLREVHADLAREVIAYLGENTVSHVELPLH